jgi:hypothetical protein
VKSVFKSEEELVERLTKHFNKFFCLREIGVGYGISDLLIIRNKADLERFVYNRNGRFLKNADEIKIFDYIRKHQGADIDELASKSYVSKQRLKYSIIKRLLDIEAIYVKHGKFYRNPSFTLFSPIVTAIEAKLEDWNKGLAQAIRYQRFAHKVYLAIDEGFIHRVDKSDFSKYNIGLISVGSKVKEVMRPIQKKPLDPIMRFKVAEEIVLLKTRDEKRY